MRLTALVEWREVVSVLCCGGLDLSEMGNHLRRKASRLVANLIGAFLSPAAEFLFCCTRLRLLTPSSPNGPGALKFIGVQFAHFWRRADNRQ